MGRARRGGNDKLAQAQPAVARRYVLVSINAEAVALEMFSDLTREQGILKNAPAQDHHV
jgi:hypothetical protein